MTDKQSGTGTSKPLGPFKVHDYESREGLWPVSAENCIYTTAYFNDRDEAEQYAAWRNASETLRAGDCPGDKEPCADVNLCANVGQCRTVGDAQHRREYVEENRDETLDTDAVRGLILNILAGHRVDQFPPEKQMLEECLRLLQSPNPAPVAGVSDDLLKALDLAARFIGGQSTPELAPGDSPDLVTPIREAISRLSRIGAVSGVGRDYKALYEELLYAVGNKYEGESRHETALRYIRRAEEPSVTGADQAAKSVNAAGDSK
jgi:hypothetical protein